MRHLRSLLKLNPVFLVSAAAFLLSGLVLTCPAIRQMAIVNYKDIRGGFFTGSVSIAAFLLAMKSNLLLKLKTEVYDKDEYQEGIKRKRAHNPDISFYGPLLRLSNLVDVSIAAGIISALLQFTIGLIQNDVCKLVCLQAGLFSVIMVGGAWSILWSEIRKWILDCEEKTRSKA